MMVGMMQSGEKPQVGVMKAGRIQQTPIKNQKGLARKVIRILPSHATNQNRIKNTTSATFWIEYIGCNTVLTTIVS